MNKELFKDKMTLQWWQKLSLFFESPDCDRIYQQLKTISSTGIDIQPKSVNTFKAFQSCELDNLNVVVICAPCKNNTGIALENSEQLKYFHRAVEQELYNGMDLELDFSNDLWYLGHQGILMLNNPLTTNVPDALWEPFMDYLFENVFNYANVPILFIGESKYYNSYKGIKFQIILKVNEEWETNNAFTQINEIVLKNNNIKVEWILDLCPF